jgi:hypothetical protein
MHQDLSPLQQLLKAHERGEARHGGEAEGQGQGQGGAAPAPAAAEAAAGAAGPAPIAVRRPPSREEAEQLRRSDDIILRVLSTYSHSLPPHGQGAPAATASAPQPRSAGAGVAGASQQLHQAPAASQGGGSEASEPAAKRARR